MTMEISVQETKEKLDKKEIILLDVREEMEYNMTHIEGSLLIPLGSLSQRINELDKNKEIVTYCHHGNRSMMAALELKEKGFSAKSMKGGIEEWSLQMDNKVPRY
jgi:rhodanese-related sulfurtransferase